MSISHLTVATDGRLPLFSSEEGRRRAVRALADVAAEETVMFAVVDDHVHLVARCERARLGRLATGLVLALRPIAEGAVEPARVRPVETKSHLGWLVRYLLTQPQHHKLPVHPALWTGSCFPDLVGARAVLRLRAAEVMPRLRLRELFAYVGLTTRPLRPASEDDIRAAGAARVVAAAGAALAVGPDLGGKEAPRVLARRAAVQVGHAAGIPLAELAWAIEQPARSARRLLAPPVEPRVEMAVRLRLALEAAAAALPVELTEQVGLEEDPDNDRL